MHELSTFGTDQLSDYMSQAVALSLTEVERGGIPFSALVVRPRAGVIGSGVNRVAADADPTAHAEVVALRNALAVHPDHAKPGDCVLFASGEPCGMCCAAAFDAQIGTILYAVDRDEAARSGFDYRGSYRLLGPPDPRKRNDVTVQAWPVTDGLSPFTAWSRRHLRGTGNR